MLNVQIMNNSDRNKDLTLTHLEKFIIFFYLKQAKIQTFSETASKQSRLVKCYSTSSLFLKKVVVQISESLHLVTDSTVHLLFFIHSKIFSLKNSIALNFLN